MRIIKVLSLICFLTIGILAQTGAVVSGTVSDAEKPLKAIVVLQQNNYEIRRTETDGNGFYKFENLRSGQYKIIVIANFNGVYEQREAKEILVDGSQNETIVNIDQKSFVSTAQATSAYFIKESVTISADTTQTLDEVSKTVNIIGSQELRDRADFSLVESLRSIPGFRVQQLGGFGRTANIKTRGLRNQDTAVLIDGVRFRDAAAITGDASAFLSDFTLTSVAKIEVLRGSGSSLYGTNAVGGTIDFQTPEPQSGFHGNVAGAFGGYGLGRFRANVSDGTKDGKFGFNIGGARTIYAKGIDGEDDAHNTNFQTRVEYNPFERTNISGRIFVSDAYVRLNSNPNTAFGSVAPSSATIIDAVPLSREELRRYENGAAFSALTRGNANFIPDANDPDAFQKSQFFNGQIVLTHAFSDRFVFQGYYSGLQTQRKNDNGILGLGFQSASSGVFKGTINTANGHFNWTPNRYNELTAGYEFETEKYGSDGFTPNGTGNFFARAGQSSNTVYVQDLLKLFNNKLQLAGGVRAQFFDLKTPSFSLTNAPYSNLTLENPPTAYTFDGAASYFFEKTQTKIRAHAGNGYRVPSLYERFGTFYSSFSNRFTALGDPNLRPEKTIAFDGGIEQNLFKNRAKLTAVYFYTKLQNVIGFGSGVAPIGNTPRTSGGYLNTKGGISRGGEFSGQIKATDSTDVFASYTFTNSDQRTPQVTGNRNIETLGIPKHQFTLVATQRFKRAWVNFDFLASSDYLAPIFSGQNFSSYVYRFKGNRRGDLTGGYNFPLKGERFNLRVFGTIENLFGDDYFENGFRTFDRNGRVGLSFGF
ncbi:MAG: TonB-dependent receptor [Pyrinomonadaceae bacterium]|nr:TonB-dependent receptor [Pyrinomonadaceae bacterium]